MSIAEIILERNLEYVHDQKDKLRDQLEKSEQTEADLRQELVGAYAVIDVLLCNCIPNLHVMFVEDIEGLKLSENHPLVHDHIMNWMAELAARPSPKVKGPKPEVDAS
jgi:hypothetical protein